MAKFGIIENGQIVNIVVSDVGYANWVPLPDDALVYIGSNIVDGRIAPPTFEAITSPDGTPTGYYDIVMNTANSAESDVPPSSVVLEGDPLPAMPIDEVVWPQDDPAAAK